MSESNGHDLGAVYQLLVGVAVDLSDFRAEADRGLGNLEQDNVSLRQALTAYHASVLGHGILISELEERVILIGELEERVRASVRSQIALSAEIEAVCDRSRLQTGC